MQALGQKKGLALLVTVFFTMLISMSIALALVYTKQVSETLSQEQFLLQNAMLVEDVLEILKGSPHIREIENAEALAQLFSEYGTLYFQSRGLEVRIQLSSARAKINPSIFKMPKALEAFEHFMSRKGIEQGYPAFLLERLENSHTYLSSYAHLQAIDDAYVQERRSVALERFATDALLYPSKDTNTSIDLNHASVLVYELLLGCESERAKALSQSGVVYEKLEDLDLSAQEKSQLSHFKTSFFEAFLLVKIELKHKKQSSHIQFEYNIKSQKGSYFVFNV